MINTTPAFIYKTGGCGVGWWVRSDNDRCVTIYTSEQQWLLPLGDGHGRIVRLTLVAVDDWVGLLNAQLRLFVVFRQTRVKGDKHGT